MITTTRVSVDAATREILDQLSTTLGHVPKWAEDLTRELPADIREVLDSELSPLKKRLNQSAIATDGVGGKLDDQISMLTGMQGATQAQAERFDKQVERIASEVKEMHEQAQIATSGQTASLTGLKFELSSAAALIHGLHSEMKSATAEIQVLRTAMLEVAQQQVTSLAISQTKLVSMQSESCELLLALRADMAYQNQVLNLIRGRLDAMSRPWWKKLFTTTEKNKT